MLGQRRFGEQGRRPGYAEVGDEIGNLGRIDALLTAATLLRSWGLTLWTFWQNAAQMQIYGGQANTLVDNAGVIQAFGARNRRMAQDIAQVSYFEIETTQAAAKIRELITLGGASIIGPWDGEEAITLFADLEAGATGAMTGGGYPDGIRRITDAYFAGRRDEAMAAYARWLPLINYENRQCGLRAAKTLMQAGGVIRSDAVRHPLQPLPAPTRAGLLELAKDLDALALRWGR